MFVRYLPNFAKGSPSLSNLWNGSAPLRPFLYVFRGENRLLFFALFALLCSLCSSPRPFSAVKIFWFWVESF